MLLPVLIMLGHKDWEPVDRQRVREREALPALPVPMNCREFRKKHLAFVDGMMNDWQTGEMYGHLGHCERCERLDIAVRRGLLVARNLPLIQPSRDFMPRLEARLREQHRVLAPPSRHGKVAQMGVAVAALAVISAVAVRLTQQPEARTMADSAVAIMVSAQESHLFAPVRNVFTAVFPVGQDISPPGDTIRQLGSLALQAANPSP